MEKNVNQAKGFGWVRLMELNSKRVDKLFFNGAERIFAENY